MSPQIIINIVLLVACFIGGMTVQSWRFGAKETKRVQQALLQQQADAAQRLRDQQQAAATAIRRIDNGITAERAGIARSNDLRRDADASRDALVRLSNAADQALRDAAASHGACIERATTLAESLQTMGAAGGELAQKADRHANDARTCREAWPQ